MKKQDKKINIFKLIKHVIGGWMILLALLATNPINSVVLVLLAIYVESLK